MTFALPALRWKIRSKGIARSILAPFCTSILVQINTHDKANLSWVTYGLIKDPCNVQKARFLHITCLVPHFLGARSNPLKAESDRIEDAS
jgi:hypothetical protein